MSEISDSKRFQVSVKRAVACLLLIVFLLLLLYGCGRDTGTADGRKNGTESPGQASSVGNTTAPAATGSGNQSEKTAEAKKAQNSGGLREHGNSTRCQRIHDFRT